MFSEAFKANKWKASTDDRYNAACSWALSSNIDSAFFNLQLIAGKSNYSSYSHIISDTDLNSLHEDPRWKPLLETIKQNKEKSEANTNKVLVQQLDSIYSEDQKYRMQIEEIEKKFGYDSKEMTEHWKLINKKDSSNLIKVKAILDKYGWAGPEVVGKEGAATLFLVIQHADLKTQEQYLPLMRQAVKNGKANASNLALLEDRVALRQGKKQIYGSQIGDDGKNHFIQPLMDPDNVDKRRAEVGLNPLADYVKRWGIVWNPEEYKKQLPELEKKFSTH